MAHLRHEVGLQLAQVRLAAQEDEHEHDAGDDNEHEADGQQPEEDVEDVPQEHEHDAHGEDEDRRDDDEVHEQLDNPQIAEATSLPEHE